MTEDDWQRCRTPRPMFEALLNTSPDLLAFDRLLRLFSAGCCRMVWEDIPADSRRAVERAETFARGEMLAERFRAAGEDWRAMNGWPDWVYRLVETTMDCRIYWRYESVDRLLAAPRGRSLVDGNLEQWRHTLQHRIDETCVSLRQYCGSKRAGPAPAGASSPAHPWHAVFQAGAADASAAMSDLLRCLVGNPLRAVEFDPRWRSSTVVGLVQPIHAERAYDRLPILGDALEEAGCDDELILDHCRADMSHAHDCWVVDLLLKGHPRRLTPPVRWWRRLPGIRRLSSG